MTTLIPSSTQQKRELALTRAQDLGMPQRRTEAYRYLNLKALRETEWQACTVAPTASEFQELRAAVKDHAFSGRQTLVFWNGLYISELSEIPTGLTVQSDFQSSELPWWSALLSEVGTKSFTVDYFDHMNESQWGRGAMLRIDSEVPLRLQFLFLNSAANATPSTWIPFQVGVELAPGARADVFENHVSLPAQAGLKAQRWIQPEMRVLVNEAARLQWTQSQNLAGSDWCVGRSRFVVKSGSELQALHISSGAQMARQNLDFHVLGEKANIKLNGISLVGPGQVTDFHTLVDHAVGQSTTQQLYKGILGSDSQAVFNGRVVIRKGAQKASSEQLNQNLLLSDRSEIDSKPELEIFADDVKATHGSAIGQLNEDEVFYLLSRGIPRAQAQEMIALGSIVGLLEDIENPELKERLSQDLSRAYQRIHE